MAVQDDIAKIAMKEAVKAAVIASLSEETQSALITEAITKFINAHDQHGSMRYAVDEVLRSAFKKAAEEYVEKNWGEFYARYATEMERTIGMLFRIGRFRSAFAGKLACVVLGVGTINEKEWAQAFATAYDEP